MSETRDTAADVRVRRAERADLLAIHRIEQASFPEPWPYHAFDRYLDAVAFLVAVSNDGDPVDGGVISTDAPVVGFVVTTVMERHGRAIGHVKDLAVHPDHRGQGIGSTLLEVALGRLAVEGAQAVKLEVRESNAPARSLYRQFGFEPLRTAQEYYQDDEDAVVMVRQLEGSRWPTNGF